MTHSAGQFHVIIGQNVGKVYTKVCELGGFKEMESVEDNEDVNEKMTIGRIGKNILDTLSGSITPLIPIMFCVCAPIGGWMGTALCNVLLKLGSVPVAGIVVIALSGGLWEFLVITGMHQVFITNMVILFTTNGFDGIVSVGATMASMAVAGMLLGAVLRIKNKDEKTLTLGYLISVFIGGITEPGLYGTALKFKRPFMGVFVGGFAGALYCAIMGVESYALIPVASFLALTGFAGGPAGNFMQGCIGGVVAIVVAAVVTYFTGFDKNEPSCKK